MDMSSLTSLSPLHLGKFYFTLVCGWLLAVLSTSFLITVCALLATAVRLFVTY